MSQPHAGRPSEPAQRAVDHRPDGASGGGGQVEAADAGSDGGDDDERLGHGISFRTQYTGCALGPKLYYNKFTKQCQVLQIPYGQ